MAGHLYPKIIKGTAYYYYQRTWREKIDPHAQGKSRGSGKSRVRTQSVYLGTAESIYHKMKTNRSPLEVYHREFGFVAAIYQTAVEIGLVSLLRQHIPGERFGVPRWLYFLLPILNRLQHATSKQRMGAWAETTILPDLLDFDPKRLTSKTFWYVTDDVISEKELRERRRKQPELTEDLFVGLDDSVFRTIEEELIRTLQSHYDLSEEILCYDTTNFFTYIEEPVRAHLAKTGHNKDCHHHCKQVGLALCVDKEWGIPLFHGVYQGNAHDSKTFAGLVEDLLTRLRIAFRQIKNLVLVLDKGNNSPENFAALQGKLHWVGSLVPSHYPDLLKLPLQNYTGQADTVRYYRCQRTVFGVPCVLVLTYNPKLVNKQEHKLRNGMEKLKRQILEKWDTYKRKPKRVPAGITRLLEDSRYGKYLDVAYENGALRFSETEKVASQRQRFGKNLLFCSNPEAESSWIITQYRSKNRVEQDFHALKNPELIRWRPTRHWTDTKIRAFGFCCVNALLLIQVMLQKVARAGLKMSATVLKEELTDLKEIVMVHEDQSAEMKISRRSSVQQKLWDLFDLNSVEQRLPYT